MAILSVKWNALTTGFLFIQTIILFCTVAVAFIPSVGQKTNDEVRQTFNDSQFRIDILNLPPIKANGYQAYIANAKNTPVLSGNDVQATVAILRMESGSSTTHWHPRGFELFTVLRGIVKTTLYLEGPSPTSRKIKLTLKYGHSTVFPIGLVHSLRCVSKRNRGCIVHAVLNSADAGSISVEQFV